MSYSNRNRGVRYRATTSASAGVLAAVVLAVTNNENIRHHKGHPLPVTGVAAVAALVAVVMFVLWSAIALYRRTARRAAERERAAAAAERERQARGRGRGRRYAGSAR